MNSSPDPVWIQDELPFDDGEGLHTVERKRDDDFQVGYQTALSIFLYLLSTMSP